MKKKNALAPYFYYIYQGMIQRCYNPDSPSYRNYGASGITVCDRWLQSIRNFAEDMGERPEGCSIDRIDSNGNYEPGNCRWACKLKQARNRKNVKMTEAAVIELLTDWHLRPRFGMDWQAKYGITLQHARMIAMGKSFLLPDYYKIVSGGYVLNTSNQFWYMDWPSTIVWNELTPWIRGKTDFITGCINGISGNVSGLCGNVSGLEGDVSFLSGDATLLHYKGCYYCHGDINIIPKEARMKGLNTSAYWQRLSRC